MNGVIIGRFMPPHRGHQYLVEFAHNYVDDLYVLVCTLSSEPIPGELRFHWMKELFPRDHIIHITEEIPEASRGEPDAERIWAESVRKAVSAPVDHVFASESYGSPLAEALGARFVPVDPAREVFPVSASLIRQDPYSYWRFIPEPVRPYFTRRVAVLTYSDALHPAARLLADHFETVFVNDYARFVARDSAGSLDAAEQRRAQHAAEEALARHARGILFCERGAASFEELSRYEMILAEGAVERAASEERPEVEDTLNRLAVEGRSVIRFNELSEGSLKRLGEAVTRELLRPVGFSSRAG
ncbi:MAG: adenylyltransferase/cytidyltransferase family protein [Spirochaetaceae bacterium]